MKATESQIQEAFIEYVGYAYPDLAEYLIHIPNEGRRSLAEGSRQKRLGLRKGVPDLFFAVPTELYHGLWIEIKAPGKKPTVAQQRYLTILGWAGYDAIWDDDLDMIIKYFDRYVTDAGYDKGRDRQGVEGASSEG